MKKNIAIILAGGTGTRMGKKLPKQFVEVGDKPLILHSVEVFSRNKNISGIILVSHPEHVGTLEELIKQYRYKKVIKIVHGGATRQISSFNGISACPKDTDLVLIHDAARPFVDDGMIDRVIDAAERYGAVTTAVDITDTIVENEKDFIKSIPDRDRFMRVQTPQGFRYEVILEAHLRSAKKGLNGATDDTSLVTLWGEKVKLVEGSERNIKITKPIDIVLAETILQISRTKKN